MTGEEYFGDWSKVIHIKEAGRIMKRLSASNDIICPTVKNVFKAFKLCPLERLRVVILGQDPYNNLLKGSPVATGIAFGNSMDTPTDSLSPSLEIIKESVINFTLPHNHINFDVSLEKWESQGVLLLNSALSCVAGKPGSHTLMWRPFMVDLLKELSRRTVGIVYILMGSTAISFESYIDHNTNVVIKTKHPSWYARCNESLPSDVWYSINKTLMGQDGYKIEWYTEF